MLEFFALVFFNYVHLGGGLCFLESRDCGILGGRCHYLLDYLIFWYSINETILK
jgi:hypothetical protein